MRTAWNKGKKLGPLSEDHKSKISNAHKKLMLPQRFLKGYTPWNKGKTSIYSEETLKKIAEGSRRTLNGYKPKELHPNWNPNRDEIVDKREERHDAKHAQWARAVKKRDGYVCQLKDEYCTQFLVAHHIKGWAKHLNLRYEINNGITLCQHHHPRKRVDEIRLNPILTMLVRQ